MVPLILFLVLYSALVSGSGTPKFGCLDTEGRVVDWWVIYKESGGVRYIYKDSKSELFLSESRLITDKKSPLSATVESAGFKNITSSPLSPFYVSWNDQPLKNMSASSEYAHAKVISLRRVPLLTYFFF